MPAKSSMKVKLGGEFDISLIDSGITLGTMSALLIVFLTRLCDEILGPNAKAL